MSSVRRDRWKVPRRRDMFVLISSSLWREVLSYFFGIFGRRLIGSTISAGESSITLSVPPLAVAIVSAVFRSIFSLNSSLVDFDEQVSFIAWPRSRMGCKLKLAFDHSVGLRRVGFYLISIITTIVIPNGVDVSHQAECVAALAVRLEKLRLFLQSSRSPDQREGSTPLQRSIEASPPVTQLEADHIWAPGTFVVTELSYVL